MAKKRRSRGEGTIFQRSNGRWRAQISINGHRFSKSFIDKADAHKWQFQMQNKVAMGQDIQGGRISLEKFLLEWLNTSNAHLQANTLRDYQKAVENYITPHLGKTRLMDLRLADIERFYATLVMDGVGAYMVKYVHRVLHVALSKAVKYSLIGFNPASGASLPRHRAAEMEVLDSSQVSQFLIAAEGSYYKPLYYLAIQTGMRQGEIFGLKWSDLQWQSGSLLVQRSVRKKVGGGWEFKDPKTRTGRRTILLGEGILQILREHREHQKLQKAFAGSEWQEHNLIFTNRVGNPCDQSNLRKDFNEILERAGLHRIRFHDLRHTAASLMLNNNVPPIVASRRLGHSRPSTTLDIYGHLYHEMQTDAARIMDELTTPVAIKLGENGSKETFVKRSESEESH